MMYDVMCVLRTYLNKIFCLYFNAYFRVQVVDICSEFLKSQLHESNVIGIWM
jgi:hypothetical protein